MRVFWSAVAAGSEYVDGVYRVQVSFFSSGIDLYRGDLNMQALFAGFHLQVSCHCSLQVSCRFPRKPKPTGS